MFFHSQVSGSKAKSERYLERLKRLHLPIKPLDGVGSVRVGSAQACPQIADAMLLHPCDRVVESVIVEVKPLTKPY